MSEVISKVLLPHGGELLFDERAWEWRASPLGEEAGEDAKDWQGYALRVAQDELLDYAYSPSHGYPGVRHAHQVAERVGGQAQIGPLPEEGEVDF